MLLWLDAEPPPLDRCGGKAASLARMAQGGLPVPRGFCIGADVWRAAVAAERARAGLAAALEPARAGTPAGLGLASNAARAYVEKLPLDPAVRDAVIAAWRALGGGPVAVRSSGIGEDGAGTSFAGQYETFLGVEGEFALLRAVRKCWSSLYSARALVYRKRRGIAADPAMAVIVQRMLSPRVSGIAFTHDPVTGSAEALIVEAVEGLGLHLAAGEAIPERWVLPRRGEPRADALGPTLLEDRGLLELRDLLLRVEGLFRRPVDVEWAWDGATFHLLQARPITRLVGGPRGLRSSPPAAPAVAPPASLVPRPEAPPPPTAAAPLPPPPPAPLGSDDASGRYSWVSPQVRERLARRAATVPVAGTASAVLAPREPPPLAAPSPTSPPSAGAAPAAPTAAAPATPATAPAPVAVPDSPAAAPPGVGADEGAWTSPIRGARWFRGRSFADFFPGPLTPLSETTLLPAFATMVHHWYRAFGLVGRHPVATTIRGFAYLRLTGFPGPAALWRFVPTTVRGMRRATHWQDLHLGPYLSEVLAARRLFDSGLPDSQLVPVSDRLVEAATDYWGAMVAARMSGLSERVLTAFYRLAVHREGDPPASRLLVGEASLPMRARESLYDLAAAAREWPDVEAALRLPQPQAIRAALSESEAGRAFLERLGSWLRNHGHLPFDLDLSQPTLGEEPRPVFEELRRFLDDEVEAPRDQSRRVLDERDDAEEAIAKRLDPLRRALFLRLLGWARTWAPAREDTLYYLGAAWPTLRALWLRAGRRLQETGHLPRPEDVFFCRREEVEATLNGDPSIPTGEVLDERRAEHAGRMRLHPPLTVPPGVKVAPIGIFRGLAAGAGPTGGEGQADEVLHGIGVSGGRVTARVVVLTSPRDDLDLPPGTILVTHSTTPAWTPLLDLASALVTDVGGVLSHASVVAREFGIPAVVGTREATRRMRTGEIWTVDGDRGVVYRAVAADRAEGGAAAPESA
ncbi:hypothetical protein L6R50_10755 [Myxococcota bacterium]|nr:hypothetical protein [Myxococcota bacterium]